MNAPAQTLPDGTILASKWRIDGTLGAGGMGTVYRACHLRNGRAAAIKLLHPQVSADPAAAERFLHEGYAANKVGHRGTVQVLDDGVAPEGPFLVMELLEGSAVDTIAEANGETLPLHVVLTIMDAALEILAAAHEKGIVHRDFKPENLFLTSDRQLKMLDFGLARVRETSSGLRLTATGVPMGTPAFMPPEQAMALWDEVDARSDIWAVGASIWTLLTGSLVHTARTAPELLVRASTQQAAPILTACPVVPPAIASVIDRALRFHRLERFADAREMRAALHQACRDSALELPTLVNLDFTPRKMGGTQPIPAANVASIVSAQLAARQAAAMSSPTATGAPITTDSQDGRRKRKAWFSVGAGALLLGIAIGVFVWTRTPHGAADFDAGSAAETTRAETAKTERPAQEPTSRATTESTEPPPTPTVWAASSSLASGRGTATATATVVGANGDAPVAPTTRPRRTAAPTTTAKARPKCNPATDLDCPAR